MTVFFDKDRGRWRYDFVLAGERHARECLDPQGQPVTSRRAAADAEAEARLKAKMAPKLPTAADLTLAEAVFAISESWLTDQEREYKGRWARELLAYAGPAKPIREMDGAWVQDFITHLVKQPVMIWYGGPGRDPAAAENAQYWKPAKNGRMRTSASVNRRLPLLRAVFERAYNTRDPQTGERAIDEKPKVKDLAEPKRKARPVPDDVLADVRTMVPDHINEAIMLTLYFGFRRDEAFGLQIGHVDFMAGGIRFENTEVKNNEDSFMHGSRAAMQFLAMLVDQANERGVKHLITWRRSYADPERQAKAPFMPLKSPKRAWNTAMKKIIKKYGKRWRWHDIRAAYITFVALNSGPIVAQKMARHADFDTTRAYIDVADEIAREAAERAGSRPALGVIVGGKTE